VVGGVHKPAQLSQLAEYTAKHHDTVRCTLNLMLRSASMLMARSQTDVTAVFNLHYTVTSENVDVSRKCMGSRCNFVAIMYITHR